MADEVALIVQGRRYLGWKTVRISRTLEGAASSFDLEVSDRWRGQTDPWPIHEEDACRVEVNGQTVIDGWVEGRLHSIDANTRSLSYRGKDRTAALVECSLVLDRWSYKNTSVLDLARTLCDPFEIDVTLDKGITLPKPPPAKTVINPGDTAFEVIERAARSAGVLVVSDGAGGLLLTRAGTQRVTTSLVEGQNIKAASADYDATGRFARYVVATQRPGTDKASGAATQVRSEGSDRGVRRLHRVRMVLAEAGISADYARRRAMWEAGVRAARAETVTITVVGWTTSTGAVWPLNHLVQVQARSIDVEGALLIVGAEHSADEGGRTTQLRLMRADAFTPEPVAVKPRSQTGWPELRFGAR